MGDEADYLSNYDEYPESEYDYDYWWEDSDLGHEGKGNRTAQRRRRKIRKDRERRLENQKGKYLSDYPFCHCGADMRGTE